MKTAACSVLLFFFALIATPPLTAQTKRTPPPRPQAAPAGPKYVVDTEESRVFIRVNRSNRLGHNHGIEGKLNWGLLVLGSGGKLIFDMNSFSADTPRARKYVGLDADFADAGKVSAKMRSSVVLDVARFPQATFAIKSINPADNQTVGAAGRYMLDGDFTLHGRTRPIRFLTEMAGTNTPGVARMTGWFKVLQSDYGIKPFSVMGGTISIENELIIYGDLVLRLDGQ
jgi:hypothetical protein